MFTILNKIKTLQNLDAFSAPYSHASLSNC